MRRLMVVPTAILFILTTSATAGPEKVAFPAYQTHVLYTVGIYADVTTPSSNIAVERTRFARRSPRR